MIRLGSTVEFEFRRPSPFSATARLRIVSRHRLPLAVDGVILMAETCIIGSNRQAHIAAPGLDGPVVLYRQGGGLCCRGPGSFEVDGHACTGRAPITTRSGVLGDGYSFSLEPLAPHSGAGLPPGGLGSPPLPCRIRGGFPSIPDGWQRTTPRPTDGPALRIDSEVGGPHGEWNQR